MRAYRTAAVTLVLFGCAAAVTTHLGALHSSGLDPASSPIGALAWTEDAEWFRYGLWLFALGHLGLVLLLNRPGAGRFTRGAQFFLLLDAALIFWLPWHFASVSPTELASAAASGSLLLLLAAAFVLGFAVTVAEPDVRVLAYQVDLASGGQIGTGLLIAAVALGVALFVALAVLRLVAGIPIAYLLAAGYVLVIALSFFTPQEFLAISFDAGGVTTGPMAVPFIMALGLGATSVLGGKSPLRDGFGLIGLASIGPVIGVMLLGVFLG